MALGRSALLVIFVVPVFSGLVIVGVFPGWERLLYESALLCHLLIAVLLLVYVVWRSFAAEHAAGN